MRQATGGMRFAPGTKPTVDYAGEERIAAGGAALHGDVVHEDRAFVADAIDVWRFADHQAAMIDARLHPSDVVAHDEEDVGLLSLLGEGRNARHCRGATRQDKSAPDCSEYAHDCFPQMSAAEPWAAVIAHLHPPTVFALADSCRIMFRAIRRAPRAREAGRSILEALCASGTLFFIFT